jgi:hypothetical protein
VFAEGRTSLLAKTGPRAALTHDRLLMCGRLWGSHWLPPAFSRPSSVIENSRRPRKNRLRRLQGKTACPTKQAS